MHVVLGTGDLFWEKDLRDFLNTRKQALFEEIDSIDADRLLTPPLEDLCDQLIEKYTVATPQIDESGIDSEFRDAKIDLRRHPDFFVFHNSGPVYAPSTRVTVYVPFTGNPELLKCRPSTFNVGPPSAVVRDSELAFEYENLDRETDSTKKNDWPGKPFHRDFNSLKKYLAWMARDLEEFNSSIRESAKQRIRARNDKFLRDRRIAESLGFPIRRATDLAGTSEAPTVEPDVAPPPSPIPTAPEAPQPSSGVPELPHADDYSWVRLGDQKTRLTPNPARAVRFIHEEYVRTGHPEVDEKRVLKECGSQQKRLYEVLRHCNAWGSVVTRGTEQGTVELNFPKPVKTRSQTRKNP